MPWPQPTLPSPPISDSSPPPSFRYLQRASARGYLLQHYSCWSTFKRWMFPEDKSLCCSMATIETGEMFGEGNSYCIFTASELVACNIPFGKNTKSSSSGMALGSNHIENKLPLTFPTFPTKIVHSLASYKPWVLEIPPNDGYHENL